MALPSNTIDKVQVGSTPFDISAKYIRTADTTPAYKTWEDITKLINIGTKIVALDTLPPLSTVAEQKTAFNNYAGDIILIPDSTKVTPGIKLEYVGITGKSSGATEDDIITSWEKIGTSEADLEDYAKKGTYNTSGPSSDVTGSEITGTGKAYDATGTASVSYKKADANTGNAGGVTINGSNFNFTGTKASLIKPNNGTTKLDHHVYTPEGSVSKPNVELGGSSTINYIKGVASGGTTSVITAAAKGISLTNDATSTTGPTYVQSVSGTFVTGVKTNASVDGTKNYGFSSAIANTADANGFAQGVMTHPVVNSSGVLSWTTVAAGTQDAHTMTQMTFNTDVVSSVTKYLKATPIAATDKATVIKSDGLSADTFTNYTSAALASAPVFTGTTATIKHTQAATLTTDFNNLTTSVATTSYDYTPEGSIGGSQTVNAHSHAITYTDTNASGSASVAILTHTHSLSNHTHSVTI